MSSKYKFEDALTPEMNTPPNECTIAALQVGFASLIEALEKQNPGVADSFFECLDYNYKLNDGALAQNAIAMLGAAVKAGLKLPK